MRVAMLPRYVVSLAAILGSHAAMAAPPGQRDSPTPVTLLHLQSGTIALMPTARADAASPPPLLVLLHGAGQNPMQMIERFSNDLDASGVVLLAPKSTGATWDIVAIAERRALDTTVLAGPVLRYSKSGDGDRVMAAVAELEKLVKTDPGRTTLLGFSDGATFALALGTARERPFTAVIALSPGLAVVSAHPAPRRPVLVMHGRNDRSLPFDFTHDTIVPALRGTSLTVRFVPFDGGHEIPAGAIARFKQEFPEKFQER